MKPSILICYAVDQEHVAFECPNYEVRYCKTGVGKVEAALAVTEAIRFYKPALVVNVATAGTVVHEVGCVHLCAKFIDRDMEKLSEFGVPYLEDFSDLLASRKVWVGSQPASVCNTGDSFMTEGGGTGDVFDMEAFAIARACRLASVPFLAVKYVTDLIGQNSVKHWADKLADAREGLKEYIEKDFFVHVRL